MEERVSCMKPVAPKGPTPESLAKSGTEEAHQTALFCWAALNVGKYPDLKWFFAIPNGGSRGDDAKTRAIRGGKLKAAGVRVGVSDTLLPVKRGPYSGLFIELKRPELRPKREGKGGASDEQLEFGAFVQQQGFGFIVCYGWQHAAEMVEQYLNYKG